MEGEILTTKINELLARYRIFVQNENHLTLELNIP